MSERDELADLYADILFRRHGIETSQSKDVADELIAAGYRKPRTVTTAAELDGLPVGSVVLDSGRTPIRREADGLWYWGEMPLTTGLILPCNPSGLTVLHEGSAS